MKKIKYLVLLIALLLFPSIVNAEGNVAITKIVKKDITGYAYEVNPPTFSGLTVNYDLSFHSIGDSVTYIATIQNSDKEAYKIENKNSFSPSGYMTYEFKFSDNTNTIKANETKDMYITIKYNKEVPIDKLVNGEYKEQNQMDLILVNSNGQILNPNTASTIIYVIAILLLLMISIVIFKKHKKASILLLTIALLIPITTYALNEIKITLNTQVVIEKDLKFCIYDLRTGKDPYNETEEPEKMYFSYTNGITIANWIDNNANLIDQYFGTNFNITNYNIEFYKQDYFNCKINSPMLEVDKMKTKTTYELEEVVDGGTNSCYSDYVELLNENNLLKNRNEGCYYLYYSEADGPEDPTEPIGDTFPLEGTNIDR